MLILINLTSQLKHFNNCFFFNFNYFKAGDELLYSFAVTPIFVINKTK